MEKARMNINISAFSIARKKFLLRLQLKSDGRFAGATHFSQTPLLEFGHQTRADLLAAQRVDQDSNLRNQPVRREGQFDDELALQPWLRLKRAI